MPQQNSSLALILIRGMSAILEISFAELRTEGSSASILPKLTKIYSEH